MFKYLVLAAMSAGLLACATHAPAPQYRKVAADNTYVDTSEILLVEAGKLGKFRSQGKVCDKDAYQSDMLLKVKQANLLRPGIVKEWMDMGNEGASEIQKHLGKTIAFQLILRGPKTTIKDIDKTVLAGMMTGGNYQSHGMGAMGHMLEYDFQPGNKMVYKQMVFEHESGNVKWLDDEGTWSVNKDYDTKLGGHVVSIKHKILTGPNKGKVKTSAYVMREDCYGKQCSFGLYPIYKARKDGGNSDPMYFKAFDQIMDECSA